MVITPNSFPAQSNLPCVYIENIKLLPPDRGANIQEIKITLSLQTLQTPDDIGSALASETLGGDYKIFVAFSSNVSPLRRMSIENTIAKDQIRKPLENLAGGIIKQYLEPPLKTKPAVISSATSSRLLHKKSLTFTQKFYGAATLKNVYIYVSAYTIDPGAITQTGLSPDTTLASMRTSFPTTEVIMRDGQVPLQSAIFSLQGSSPASDTVAWTGPVHWSPSRGFMAGVRHTRSDHPSLRTTRVSNQKVTDLRFLENVNNLSFSTNGLNFFSPKMRKDFEKAVKVIKKSSAVSDCSYSRTTNNDLKIFFSIDYAKLVRENTKLGPLFQNNTGLMSCFKIDNIQVWRSRINPSNTEPNALTPGRISICGSNIKDPSASGDKLVATLQNGSVYPIQVSGLNDGILSVVATDTDMAKHDYGAYEYKVVMEMMDMTAPAINYAIDRLTKFSKAYGKFLTVATEAGKKGNVVQHLKSRAREILSGNQEWKQLISFFIVSVEFIFGTSVFGQLGSMGWRKNLISMANPANGDLASMLLVDEVIKNFISRLSQASKPPTTPGATGSSKAKSMTQAQNSSTRKINLEKVFSSNYVVRASAAEGTDYLDNSLTLLGASNLTSIAFVDYGTRVNAELAKFSVPQPNNPGVNKFGFLTPKRLNTQGSVIETSEVNLSQELGNGILNATLQPGRSRSFIPGNESEKISNSEIDGILGSSGVSIVPNTTPIGKILVNGAAETLETIDSSNYFSSESPFNNDDPGLRTSQSGSEEASFESHSLPSQQIKSSPIVGHIIQSAAINFKPTAPFVPSPAAMGSLAVASAGQAPEGLDLNSTFGQTINYNSIAAIQYFAGYKVSNGSINLKDPSWVTLTEEEFRDRQNANTRTLCRLLLVTPPMRMPNKYELPPYENLFVLGNTPAGPSNLNYGASDYLQVFDSIWRRIQSDSNSTSLDPFSDVSFTYSKVPLDVVQGASLAAGAPRPNGAGGTSSTGGAY